MFESRAEHHVIEGTNIPTLSPDQVISIFSETERHMDPNASVRPDIIKLISHYKHWKGPQPITKSYIESLQGYVGKDDLTWQLSDEGKHRTLGEMAHRFIEIKESLPTGYVQKLEHIAELMKEEEADFPPVLLFAEPEVRNGHVCDGMHRMLGYLLASYTAHDTIESPLVAYTGQNPENKVLHEARQLKDAILMRVPTRR